MLNCCVMAADLGWKEAIVAILEQAAGPLHYSEIAKQIYDQKLRSEPTPTPNDTVASVITTSIKYDAEKSPFIRTARGYYALRNSQLQSPQASEDELKEGTVTEATGVINAFGMFWERSKVSWNSSQPAILGQQQFGAKPVDFADQKGVYLLHDSQGVLYVGRVTKQNLAMRLAQHVYDRLAGRWTRFSWFGVYPVQPDGTLNKTVNLTGVEIDIVIATMEAVLIEGLEPRQNRKRGDEFQAVEYLQVEDPKLERDRKLKAVQELMSQVPK